METTHHFLVSKPIYKTGRGKKRKGVRGMVKNVGKGKNL